MQLAEERAKLEAESRRTSLATDFGDSAGTNDRTLTEENKQLQRELALAKEQASGAMSKAKKSALGAWLQCSVNC